MNFAQIEEEALHLSLDERASLAQKLLVSLETPEESEVERAWLEVAKKRADELATGVVKPVPAEEVRRKAMKLLK